MAWLASSFIPLRPKQVAEIVGFKSPDFVLQICYTLLVTILDDEVDQVIKFAHFSVKEFIVVKSLESETSWYQFPRYLGHRTVAIATLRNLLAQRWNPLSSHRPPSPHSTAPWNNGFSYFLLTYFIITAFITLVLAAATIRVYYRYPYDSDARFVAIGLSHIKDEKKREARRDELAKTIGDMLWEGGYLYIRMPDSGCQEEKRGEAVRFCSVVL